MPGFTLGQLRREIAREAGFDRDPANWSPEQTRDVWDLIRNSIEQVLRPPRLPGDFSAYQWSFLRPMLTMQLTVGVGDYNLPQDFAYLDGGLFYVAQDRAVSQLRHVNEGRILERRQQTWTSSPRYYPQLFAIVVKDPAVVSEQTYELRIWPYPDAAYTVQGRYHARIVFPEDDMYVPPGGQEHAQLFRASAMDMVEKMLDDSRGERHDAFLEQLAASIDFDRRASSSGSLGYNGDPGMCRRGEYDGTPRALSGMVTLEKFPLDGEGEGEPPAGGGGMVTQDGEQIVTQDGEVVIPQP